MKNGQLIEALQSYNEAYKLEPLNDKITFNMGNLVCYHLEIVDRASMNDFLLYLSILYPQYLRMGDVFQSEAMYRRSIEINPNSELAHINLIIFYINRGRFMDYSSKLYIFALEMLKTYFSMCEK